MSSSLVKPRRCVSGVDEASLFAYWLWSCVVTVLILLTKYWRPRDVTLLNYFLQPRSITSACWICTTDGRSISLAATIRPPPTPLTPQSPTPLAGREAREAVLWGPVQIACSGVKLNEVQPGSSPWWPGRQNLNNQPFISQLSKHVSVYHHGCYWFLIWEDQIGCAL